jgi:phospholipid-binding lipoprotein MlaA
LSPVFGLVLLVLAGCTVPNPSGINDPYEERNRRVHEANRDVDRALIAPLAGGTGSGASRSLLKGVGNFASNLNLPSVVFNDLLQFRLGLAAQNSTRFLINTTVGIGGLFDPSTAMGLHEESTDFGETLHVWGMPEGKYVELPLVGPSTERDMIGTVVDIFTNPLTFGAPAPERYLSPLVKGAMQINSRLTYADTVDSILYDSADSYAQARLIYLQSRRYKLGQTVEEGASDDPYADPYE